ncbi:hypothetical protein IMSAG249_00924 [Lachnospiraceae bacterium]|nr:hypothetical protein IMSAG249_00924 [Lachnospiraceae bacterium]
MPDETQSPHAPQRPGLLIPGPVPSSRPRRFLHPGLFSAYAHLPAAVPPAAYPLSYFQAFPGQSAWTGNRQSLPPDTFLSPRILHLPSAQRPAYPCTDNQKALSCGGGFPHRPSPASYGQGKSNQNVLSVPAPDIPRLLRHPPPGFASPLKDSAALCGSQHYHQPPESLHQVHRIWCCNYNFP